jgi:hypothetical protein
MNFWSLDNLYLIFIAAALGGLFVGEEIWGRYAASGLFFYGLLLINTRIRNLQKFFDESEEKLVRFVEGE